MTETELRRIINKWANEKLVLAHATLRRIERNTPSIVGTKPYTNLVDSIAETQRLMKEFNGE